MTATKRCRLCLQTLPLANFAPRTKTGPYLRSECRACATADRSARRRAQPKPVTPPAPQKMQRLPAVEPGIVADLECEVAPTEWVVESELEKRHARDRYRRPR